MNIKFKLPLWVQRILLTIVILGISVAIHYLLVTIVGLDISTVTNYLLILVSILALFSWWIQRKFEGPKLTASYKFEEPMARFSRHRIKISDDPEEYRICPNYDFHFLVENSGMSSARNVVADVVEFLREDESGSLVIQDDWLPVPLRYHKNEFVQLLHPERKYYWNIGTIYSPENRPILPAEEQDKWLGKEEDGLCLRLDLWKPPYEQIRLLPEGTYGIRIMLYSENAATEEIKLKIKWSGEWPKTENEMLEKGIIEQVQSFKDVDRA